MPARLLASRRPGSPWLARFVLLGVLGAGLAGLALPHGPSTLTALSAVSEEPPVLHAGVVAHSTLIASPAGRTARASRSRSQAAWVRPVSAGVVSPYGRRWGRMHEGVDFGANTGASILAVGPGVVIGAGFLAEENGYGKIVLIRHSDGVVTAYAHMSRVLVHSGERVRGGDLIGKVGSTGHSTGPHLHFEVRVNGGHVNPVSWLRRHGVHV